MMNCVHNVLLGRGGHAPGLEAYDMSAGCVEDILRLPYGSSVYAIDLAEDGKTIAAGTKAGDLQWLVREDVDGANDGWIVRQARSGAPILSVCFADSSTVVVSDTMRRCLLWPTSDGTQRNILPIGQGAVYSLFRLDHMHVAGLSVSGELLVWNWRERGLVKVLEVPGPPSPSALVTPVYWPVADTWAWPSRNGQIVFWHWPDDRLHVARGHGGDIYAVVVCGEELLTIGRSDGRLRRWHASNEGPVGDCEAPPGIVSAVSWADQTFDALLIDEAGRAAVYSWDGCRLERNRWLHGQDYRVAVGPNLEAYRSWMQERRALRAKKLASQTREAIRQRQRGEIEACCRTLSELGFGHVALGLRAEEARDRDDVAAELRAYDKLMKILPHSHDGSRASLEQYARLLETVWCSPGALPLYEQLLQVDPDNSDYQAGAQRACERAKIIRGGSWAIEPNVSLQVLVKAATALGQSFTGRYLIRKIEPPITCRVPIAARELVEQYEQVRHARPEQSLPRADQLELSWLSGSGCDRVTTVLFAERDSGGSAVLEYGIKFFDAGLQTVLAPVTVLNARSRHGGVSIERHNAAMLEAAKHVETASLSAAGWLQMVHNAVNFVIRQLINRGRASRMRPL